MGDGYRICSYISLATRHSRNDNKLGMKGVRHGSTESRGGLGMRERLR